MTDRMTLWTGEDFVAATGGRPHTDAPGPIGGTSIDTRTIEPGDAFFAIAGDRFDGHDFASKALSGGAAALVIREDRAIALGHLRVPKVLVPDVLGAMENVGRAARARFHGSVIGVTGSVGKTTVKEMLRAALTPSGETHAAVRSFNNHWGVPLTLSRLHPGASYGVFEIGMNAPGEIRSLVGMVRPHVAIVTRIAPAHLGGLGSIDAIVRAKGEIFEGVEAGGTAVLNADDPHMSALRVLAHEAGVTRHRTFGEAEGADVRLLTPIYRMGAPARVSIDGTVHALTLKLPGRHNLLNALGALAVATAVGADASRAVEALNAMEPVEGRGTREEIALARGSLLLIDESYNANPVSMVAALETLRAMPQQRRGRRVAILGDMLELGETSLDLHADLAEAVRAAGVDLVLLVGPHMAALAERLGDQDVHHTDDAESMERIMLRALKANDTVMVKASNGTGLGRLVRTLRERSADYARRAPDADQDTTDTGRGA